MSEHDFDDWLSWQVLSFNVEHVDVPGSSPVLLPDGDDVVVVCLAKLFELLDHTMFTVVANEAADICAHDIDEYDTTSHLLELDSVPRQHIPDRARVV